MRLPGPVRAAVGLVASAAEEARHLPDRAIELPMLAVSSALQMSLRAQQRYAKLAARGDQVLTRTAVTDDPPAWATFDEPVSVEDLRRTALGEDAARASSGLFDHLFGVSDPTAPAPPADTSPAEAAPAEAAPKAPSDAPATTASKTPTKTASKTASKTPAKTPPKKAPKKAAAKATKPTPSKPTPAKSTGKTVSKPRHTAPSRFDDVGDTDT